MKKNNNVRPLSGARDADPARIKAFQTGLSAESRACVLLLAKGYRILARRFRTAHGEIDVVARQRDILVFVEVKARAALDDAAWAVTPRQQQRIAAAAQAWLMMHPHHANLDCRFDAILVAPKRFPRHLKAAFDTSP
jgi:putative endonuclease